LGILIRAKAMGEVASIKAEIHALRWRVAPAGILRFHSGTEPGLPGHW
jgi:hypothetical protein